MRLSSCVRTPTHQDLPGSHNSGALRSEVPQQAQQVKQVIEDALLQHWSQSPLQRLRLFSVACSCTRQVHNPSNPFPTPLACCDFTFTWSCITKALVWKGIGCFYSATLA